jgi:hypothetical protein
MGGSYAREHECDVDAFDRQTDIHMEEQEQDIVVMLNLWYFCHSVWVLYALHPIHSLHIHRREHKMLSL